MRRSSAAARPGRRSGRSGRWRTTIRRISTRRAPTLGWNRSPTIAGRWTRPSGRAAPPIRSPEARHAGAVDVEILARAIEVGVRHAPPHRRGNIAGGGDAAEGDAGDQVVDVLLPRHRTGESLPHVAGGPGGGDDDNEETVLAPILGEW